MKNETKAVLSLREAENYTGLSRYMLKRIIQAGQINAIDVGTGERKHLRLNRRDLDSFIEERRK